MIKKTLTPAQKIAYKNLNIPENNRVILCLDGGGIRGILTLQLLKKIEEIAGIPCHQFCDFIAGTSTGAIISGLMSVGKTAAEIEELYIKLVSKVFLKRGVLAGRFVDPPKYDKKNYRAALKEVLGNITVEEACKKTGIDLLITAKDMTDNEETFFTCFTHKDELRGTYKDALLRVIMEATMSAPTYFRPMERFVDGGTTTYNNPSLAAMMEAVNYGGAGKYKTDYITLFSLGTGMSVKSVPPDDMANPKGLDIAFWLGYVMDESSQDASSMQVDTFRSKLMGKLDYRRFQISLDSEAFKKLPDKDISHLENVKADWLKELKDDELSSITMDDVSKFELLKIIGEAMTEYVMQKNKFTRDLNDTSTQRDELITAFGNPSRIIQQISSPDWIDKKVPS